MRLTLFITLFQLDTATNTVIATIPVGIFPYGVAVTPDVKKSSLDKW
jgi:DNA-binding beta-propeller fold protein YncE